MSGQKLIAVLCILPGLRRKLSAVIVFIYILRLDRNIKFGSQYFDPAFHAGNIILIRHVGPCLLIDDLLHFDITGLGTGHGLLARQGIYRLMTVLQLVALVCVIPTDRGNRIPRIGSRHVCGLDDQPDLFFNIIQFRLLLDHVNETRNGFDRVKVGHIFPRLGVHDGKASDIAVANAGLCAGTLIGTVKLMLGVQVTDKAVFGRTIFGAVGDAEYRNGLDDQGNLGFSLLLSDARASSRNLYGKPTQPIDIDLYPGMGLHSRYRGKCIGVGITKITDHIAGRDSQRAVHHNCGGRIMTADSALRFFKKKNDGVNTVWGHTGCQVVDRHILNVGSHVPDQRVTQRADMRLLQVAGDHLAQRFVGNLQKIRIHECAVRQLCLRIRGVGGYGRGLVGQGVQHIIGKKIQRIGLVTDGCEAVIRGDIQLALDIVRNKATLRVDQPLDIQMAELLPLTGKS